MTNVADIVVKPGAKVFTSAVDIMINLMSLVSKEDQDDNTDNQQSSRSSSSSE